LFPVSKFCYRNCYRIIVYITIHITRNIPYHITEVFIFYADKLIVIGNSKNPRVFNFAILLKSQKSLKFDAREIYMFYSKSTVWQRDRWWSTLTETLSVSFYIGVLMKWSQSRRRASGMLTIVTSTKRLWVCCSSYTKILTAWLATTPARTLIKSQQNGNDGDREFVCGICCCVYKSQSQMPCSFFTSNSAYIFVPFLPLT